MNTTLLLVATIFPLHSQDIGMIETEKTVYIAVKAGDWRSEFVQSELEIKDWTKYARSEEDIPYLQSINKARLNTRYKWKYEFIDGYDQRFPFDVEEYPVYRIGKSATTWEYFDENTFKQSGNVVFAMAREHDLYYLPELEERYEYSNYLRGTIRLRLENKWKPEVLGGSPKPPPHPQQIMFVFGGGFIDKLNRPYIEDFPYFRTPEPYRPHWMITLAEKKARDKKITKMSYIDWKCYLEDAAVDLGLSSRHYYKTEHWSGYYDCTGTFIYFDME